MTLCSHCHRPFIVNQPSTHLLCGAAPYADAPLPLRFYMRTGDRFAFEFAYVGAELPVGATIHHPNGSRTYVTARELAYAARIAAQNADVPLVRALAVQS
jgi:hypothetical protein